MRVKISWDQGATFERECWLDECIQKDWDIETYQEACRELSSCGRYWLGGGAVPIALIVKV